VVPGPLGIASRHAGAAARRRLEEMVGQLGQVRAQIWRVQRLERLPGRLVQPEALAGRDALIQAVADQCVREPQPARSTGNLRHHPGSNAVVEDVQPSARPLPTLVPA
jgi:hypothetical protein